jgi:hypothetical protein
VLDDVPDNQPFPYITLGEETETDKPNSHTSRGRESTITIHVWSRARGFEEIKQIAGRIILLLEDRELIGMAGWSWEQTSYEFFQTLRDPDGLTRHGVLRFRVRSRRD